MEPYVGVLHQLQSAVLYTLSVRISYVEGGEFFCQMTKIKTDENWDRFKLMTDKNFSQKKIFLTLIWKEGRKEGG